jgi:hypothetical protein
LAEGVSYDLNWSICGSGVVPLGGKRLPELKAAGGSAATAAPAEIAFAKVKQEIKGALGSQAVTHRSGIRCRRRRRAQPTRARQTTYDGTIAAS